jgi:hypothetical protein
MNYRKNPNGALVKKEPFINTGYDVNPDPALKRGALGSPGFTAFIPVVNHGVFCGAG